MEEKSKTAAELLEESWSWKHPDRAKTVADGVAWLVMKGFTTEKDLHLTEGFISRDKLRMNMKIWLPSRQVVDIIVYGETSPLGMCEYGWSAEYVFEDRHVEAFSFGLRGACNIPVLKDRQVDQVVFKAVREAAAVYELYAVERERDEKARNAAADFIAERRNFDTGHKLKAEDCQYIPLIKEDPE